MLDARTVPIVCEESDAFGYVFVASEVAVCADTYASFAENSDRRAAMREAGRLAESIRRIPEFRNGRILPAKLTLVVWGRE